MYENLYTGFYPIDELKEIVSTKIIQMLIQIDRSSLISTEKLKADIVFLGKMYGRGKKDNRWERLSNYCRV